MMREAAGALNSPFKKSISILFSLLGKFSGPTCGSVKSPGFPKRNPQLYDYRRIRLNIYIYTVFQFP